MDESPEQQSLSKLERLKLEREFRAFGYAQQKAKTDQRLLLMRQEIETREQNVAKLLLALKDSFVKIAAGGEVNTLEAAQMQQRLKNYTVLEKQLEQAIGALGLEEISALGQEVDAARHFVESTVSDESKPNGIIVAVQEPGYTLQGRVIRPARVIVVKNE